MRSREPKTLGSTRTRRRSGVGPQTTMMAPLDGMSSRSFEPESRRVGTVRARERAWRIRRATCRASAFRGVTNRILADLLAVKARLRLSPSEGQRCPRKPLRRPTLTRWPAQARRLDSEPMGHRQACYSPCETWCGIPESERGRRRASPRHRLAGSLGACRRRP